jgi:uncharacterized protein
MSKGRASTGQMIASHPSERRRQMTPEKAQYTLRASAAGSAAAAAAVSRHRHPCFSPVIYKDAGARPLLHATREVPGSQAQYYLYARLPAARRGCGCRTATLPHACRRGTVEGLKFRMALLPLFRSRTNERELERRIYALQTALDQCKGVARTWWSMRVRFTVAVALVAMAAGFALGVYRHSIREAFVDSAVAVGLASPADEAGTAEIAFQRADYGKALKLARPLAEAGDARAEAIVGSAYYRGRGVAQSDSEAAKWFRLAADQGNAVARFTLGVMYGEGRGVPQDYAEAARWYRLAAEQGDAQAQYNLGLAYARGEGVTQDAVDAHMWFNLAAARFPANDTRNRTAAVKNRDTVANEMSSEQLAEAQKRAREWTPRS